MENQPNQPLQPVAPAKVYNLDKEDAKSIAKGLLVAVGGAALTYLTGVVGNTNFTVHYGGSLVNFTPVAYIIWSGVVNVGRKYFDGV